MGGQAACLPGTDPPDRSFASVHPREGIVVLGGIVLEGMGHLGGRAGGEAARYRGS